MHDGDIVQASQGRDALPPSIEGGGFTALAEAMRLATMGQENKMFCTTLDDFIERYHDAVLSVTNPRAWGMSEAIWRRKDIPYRNHGDLCTLADRLSSEAILAQWSSVGKEAMWDKFRNFVRDFKLRFGDDLIIERVFEAYRPDGDISIVYHKSKNPLTFTGVEADAIRESVETLAHIVLALRCVTTQGVHRLMQRAEDIYQQNTRRKGLLTFGDIPRLIAGLDKTIRLNVEYRFDGRFKHWMLDEFQDTSREQWDAIRNLVEEIIVSDGERSLLIVGDTKQAIYGWRGGDVKLFEAEEQSGHYELGALTESHRFRPEIAHLVNCVFDGDSIAAFMTGDVAEAGERWRRLWAKHTSAKKGEVGYVEVMRVRPKDRSMEEEIWEPFVEPIIEELEKVRPWERGITTAILVNRNAHGEELANALREADIPAVWEGESALADTPVVMAFLNLLRFAEHPGDTLAWQHICATPLMRQGVLGELGIRKEELGIRNYELGIEENLKSPNLKTKNCKLKTNIARKVQSDVVEMGLPRALQTYIDGIWDTVKDDSFTRSRLDALVRAASQFTGMADAKASLTDFAEFVMSFKTRTVAESGVVKILTLHRSKGLGFDFVLLPVMDHYGVNRMRSDDVFGDPDGRWLLDKMPPMPVVEMDATLCGAMRTARSAEAFEALCGYYVGMTRAKVALKVLLRDGGGKLHFSSYVAGVCESLPCMMGDAKWWKGWGELGIRNEELGIRNEELRIRNEELGIEETASALSNHLSTGGEFMGEVQKSIKRRVTPSALHARGGKGIRLFGEGTKKVAARRGTDIHELLQQVEWVTERSTGIPACEHDKRHRQECLCSLKEEGIDLEVPSAFADALKKPEGFVELWRERSFEVVDGGAWMSGTFDRVVFTRTDGELCATVYDYKTNRRQEGETSEQFAERMREIYVSQMDAYRSAVARLIGIPKERIRTILLLSETMEIITN